MTNAPSSGWKRGRFGENLSVTPAAMRATSPRVIMPTPTLRESGQLKRQTFAARPQPMILVMRATTTKQTLKSRMVGVRPLMSVLRPMLAKKTGEKRV